MNVDQRLADVKQLKSDVCHDFFNMIIRDGWQDALYQVASRQVTTKGRFMNAYSDVYSKMRERDINNLANEYKVEDMDISLMRTIADFWNGSNYKGTNYAPMMDSTFNALTSIKDDRNDEGHFSGNEETEEKYLQGLLSLVILRQFIKRVDKNETSIPDSERLAYFQKYIFKINALKDTLDAERIEFVQNVKEIERDIQQIMNSKDPMREWCDIYKLYSESASVHQDDDKEKQRLQEFCIQASDAGIKEAHGIAAIYFIHIDKNPTEAVRRMEMTLDAYPEKLPVNECVSIVSNINIVLCDGYELTEKMKQLIEGIKKRGYVTEWCDGKLVLPEIEKREEEKRHRIMEEAEAWELVVQKRKQV